MSEDGKPKVSVLRRGRRAGDALVIDPLTLDRLCELLEQIRGCAELLEQLNRPLKFAPRAGLSVIKEKVEAAENLLATLPEVGP